MTFSLAQGANSLLFNLVMELRGGNIRRCEALGLKPEEMRLLRSLTMEELHYLSGSPVSVLNVAIHHENLKRMLDQPIVSKSVANELIVLLLLVHQ